MELLQINTNVSLEWLLGTAGTIIFIVAAAWLNMKLNIANLMLRITQVEKNIEVERATIDTLKKENKEMFSQINIKLDKILDKQNEQSVEIALKQDIKK